MLKTKQIIDYLSQIKYFKGVYPIDCLPVFMEVPASIVINLEPHYMDGSHWVVVHIDKSRYAHYFDSFGRRPEGNILTFIEKNAPRGYTYNKIKFKANESIACGYFCLLFIMMAQNQRKFYKIMAKCLHIENEMVTYVLVKKLLCKNMSKS